MAALAIDCAANHVGGLEKHAIAYDAGGCNGQRRHYRQSTYAQQHQKEPERIVNHPQAHSLSPSTLHGADRQAGNDVALEEGVGAGDGYDDEHHKNHPQSLGRHFRRFGDGVRAKHTCHTV